MVVHPPRPRVFLDADGWRPQLEGLFRLYSRQPYFFHRNWGRYFPAAVAWRLGIGSTAKQLIIHSRWITRNPALYFKFLRLIIRERLTLLRMLPRFWRERQMTPGVLPTNDASGRARSR